MSYEMCPAVFVLHPSSFVLHPKISQSSD